MEHNSENLDHFSAQQQSDREQKPYTPRPKGHIIMAWVLIAVVLFAFAGTCFWMVNY